MASTTETIRLFTGLPIADTLAGTLSGLPRDLKGRWVHPHDYHITIRFLGDVDQGRLPGICEALKRVKCKPFGLDVAGLSCFCSRKQTLLYADVRSTRKLNHLCAEVTDALAPLGFDFGTRPYEPHVTVARFDAKTPVEPWIEKHGGKVRGSWEATGFHLFQSASPNDNGERYHALGWYPFT